jgi:hypothetical protein
MTLAALPAMSHLSWARRSPVARRQLSTWRATNKTQNTGTARKAITSTKPSVPAGKGLWTSCPLPCTTIRVPLICQAPPPSKMAMISAQTAR